MVFSDSFLSRVQAMVEETFTDTCTVLRPARFSDDAGGFIVIYEEHATDIACRVRAQGMQPWEKIDRIGDRTITMNVFLIALPIGTSVEPSDRIRVDTLDVTYEVIGVDAPRSGELHRTAQATRRYEED